MKTYGLWFDVEQRYNSIQFFNLVIVALLWFDVEQRYNSIKKGMDDSQITLWFDVEQRYNSILSRLALSALCCGLM